MFANGDYFQGAWTDGIPGPVGWIIKENGELIEG